MKLFKHQEEGIAFLQSRLKVILADEMGLGKTTQAIQASIGTTVVICPATLKLTPWAQEISEQVPGACIKIINGAKEELYKAGARTFYIVNYDVIDKNLNYIMTRYPETVILDEAHYIKNTTSKRAKAAIKICELPRLVFLLTGTPISNRPVEYFNLLKAIGHQLARNYFGYVKRYCGARDRFMRGRHFLDVSGATNLMELHERTKDVVLRRTKAEVLDLPPKIRAIVPLELDKKYKQEYAQVWDTFITNFRALVKPEDFDTLDQYNHKVENVNLARQMIEITKCLQVISKAKVDRLEEDLANIVEQGNKAIVFTRYKETLNEILGRLSKLGIPSVAIDGSTSQEHRKAAVDLFQTDDRIKIFVGNLMAAGVGITLTKATIVIFADLYWEPGILDQAEDRAHRIGQNGTVNIYYYAMRGTLDDRIIKILTRKREIINQVINGKVNKISNNSGITELFKDLGK